MKWRLTATITTPHGQWTEVYDSEEHNLRDYGWTMGFICGYAHAFEIEPDQIKVKLEEYIDHDDGHNGGYPHFHEVEW